MERSFFSAQAQTDADREAVANCLTKRFVLHSAPSLVSSAVVLGMKTSA